MNKPAVQVVDFVVEGAGHEISPLQRADLAVQIHRFDHAAIRPPHPLRETGQAEAALLVRVGPAILQDPRVDEDVHFPRLLTDAEVDDGDLKPDAHLVGGQADTRGGVHRLDHVPDETLDVGCDLAHGLGFDREHFVRVAEDGQDRHEGD